MRSLRLIGACITMSAVLVIGSSDAEAQLSTSPGARAALPPISQAVGGTNRNVTVYSNRNQTYVVQQYNGQQRTYQPGYTYGRYSVPSYPYVSGYPTSRFGPYDRSNPTVVPGSAQRVIRVPSRRSRSIRIFNN